MGMIRVYLLRIYHSYFLLTCMTFLPTGMALGRVTVVRANLESRPGSLREGWHWLQEE